MTWVVVLSLTYKLNFFEVKSVYVVSAYRFVTIVSVWTATSYIMSLFCSWLLILCCTLADHSREDFATYQLVTLGEPFNLSVLPFLICKIGIITASTSWFIMRIKRVTTSEVLRAGLARYVLYKCLFPSQRILHLLSEKIFPGREIFRDYTSYLNHLSHILKRRLKFD